MSESGMMYMVSSDVGPKAAQVFMELHKEEKFKSIGKGWKANYVRADKHSGASITKRRAGKNKIMIPDILLDSSLYK